MIIRDERPSDRDTITAVTVAAFTNHPFSRQTEQFIINALRKAGALTLSLVAEVEGRVVGHIAFSPLTVGDGSRQWYGMGPVSVAPELQRRGIGSALVRAGLERLKQLGAQGCALVGDPHFYERFGFRNLPELTLAGVPPEVFQCLRLGGGAAKGKVAFHKAFGATS